MSKEFMTIPQAAQYLELSEKTVARRVREGFFTVHRKVGSRKYLLDPQEVAEHRQDDIEARNSTRFTKAEFLKLRAQVRKLDFQMQAVMKILDDQGAPLNITVPYAKDLHEACTGQLQQATWTIEEIEPWVEVFFRLDEDDFHTMAEAVENKKPWLVFLKLCISMTAFVSTHQAYQGSLELQTLHRRLAEARRRLRLSAMVYTETHQDIDPDLKRYGLLEVPSSIGDSVASSIRRK